MEKNIIQEELKNCPGIVYYPQTNTLELFGRSIPENPELIFGRLDTWISVHLAKNSGINFNVRLEYINSGSSKYLYEIFKKLTDFGNSGKEVKIIWLFEEEDEAMMELGEHYRDTVKIPMTVTMIV